ncbi:MAG: DUF1553 domain-containing protein, partial [Armatimonadetes bacterium]|nr:DUF1553 domain-containing protein [Armatimonadota bacterium]
VTSSTYRMDSTPDPGAVRRDPENRWLWRFAPRRLEAEAIRDSVLAAAELLDPTQGGPDLDPAQGQRVYRRSLYFRTSMEKYVPFLAAFDLANVNECYQRSESIVPQQALALANSPLALTASRTLAATLTRTSGSGPQSDRAFLTGAFLRLLGREPNAEELRQCAEFVQNQARRLAHPEALTAVTSGAAAPTPAAADPAQRARESLVHALLNHHEFVTLR